MKSALGPSELAAPDQGRDMYLALSGGGFRATAHHLGVILAYLRHDVHRRLFIVNGVSGGAIAAGHYGSWLGRHQETSSGLTGLEALQDFIRPLVALMRSGLRRRVLLRASVNAIRRLCGINGRSLVATELDKWLFHGRMLNKLAFPPFFVFTATELRSASSFYLSTGGLGFRPRWLIVRHILEDRFGNLLGMASETAANTPVALAVAVSACFPPIFRPIKVRLTNKEAEEFRRSPNFTTDWSYYEHFVSSPQEREAPIDAELLDGGVSDNKGTNFFVDWIVAAKTHGDNPSGIKFVLGYDAGQLPRLELTLAQRLSRIKLALAIQSRIYSRREILNDTIIRRVAQEHGAEYALHRAVPGLAEEIGLPPATLDALLKLRTDLDRFTDTEIFALAYSGYRLAEFGFQSLKLIETEPRPAQDTFKEFADIVSGVLSPLPQELWENHLRCGRSRLMLYRGIKRYFYGA